MVKNILISDFDYPLPDARIAKHPLAERDSCRLLVSRSAEEAADLRFSDLPGLLPEGSLLVCNDTRVINARMRFEKETGARIEVFLLEPIDPNDYVLTFQSRGCCTWACMVGNLKRWKEGQPLIKEIETGGRRVRLTATRGDALPGNSHVVRFAWDEPSVTFASIVEAAGYIPIPPYLGRDSEASDADDYQTVFAHWQGSVAAPTAGLHFTPRLLDEIRNRGVERANVTLHVGAGTFQPVKSDRIGDHPMHTEVFTVSRSLIDSLLVCLKEGRPVTAVGTTSVRTLESLPLLGANIMGGDSSLHVGQWQAYDEGMTALDTREALSALATYMDQQALKTLTASTSIMIAPGFRWRIVSAMVTNFHQPQSTLLLLVSSFLGATGADKDRAGANVRDTALLPRWRGLYDHALRGDYRFLSYGDACYFERPVEDSTN